MWPLYEHHGQILAGDEIETTFGGRLGLSTLAAAGLGNLLSDLVGLAMAEPIQARSGCNLCCLWALFFLMLLMNCMYQGKFKCFKAV